MLSVTGMDCITGMLQSGCIKALCCDGHEICIALPVKYSSMSWSSPVRPFSSSEGCTAGHSYAHGWDLS